MTLPPPMPADRTILQGLVAPAFTPMHPDGSLNLGAVEALADHAVAHRLAGVFVGGTSGEGPALTVPERQQLLERWVAAAAGRLPVIAHVGHAAIADAQQLAAHAQGAGASAVAAVPPFYFKPADAAQIADCCARIAGGAPELPFYYYHIPSMTGVRVAMREVMEVAADRVPTFAGLKFSDSDLADFGRCVSFAGSQFGLFFGRDEMLLPALAIGARAAIGTTYNLFAPLYHLMVEKAARAELPVASRYQHHSRELITVMERHGGLPAMKAAMGFAGVDCGPCRPPLRRLDARQREALRADLELFGFSTLTRPVRSATP